MKKKDITDISPMPTPVPVSDMDASILAPHVQAFTRARAQLSVAVVRLFGEGAELRIQNGNMFIVMPPAETEPKPEED